MTRVLFVDDEPRVLDGLRRTLRPHRSQWDMTFALGGEAALEELSRTTFDVLVTDMRMPVVDGVALLTAARERWPQMVRIVLSGYMDHEAAVRCTSLAHQFLSKPCVPGALEEVIGRTRRMAELLSSPALRAVVGEVGSLAASPAVYTELESVVADPGAGVADVAALIERDVSLTAKVLQLVNSSFFGIPRQVSAVTHATSYLGVNVIRALVLSHEIAGRVRVQDLPPGFSLAAHQMHALGVAALARRIAGSGPAADDAFLAGVLHDVGELLLATRRPSWFTARASLAAERGVALHEAERALFGVSHAEVGAYLVGLWGLPFRIVAAIADHHVPGRAGPSRELGALAAVHLAEALVEATSARATPGAPPSALDAEYVEALGVAARIEQWRELAAAQQA